jgi:hypothetical protein
MRKIWTFLIFLLVIPFTYGKSFATSGACSGHGGVNCRAGFDSDGSVICNDGWQESSVDFSDSIACRNKTNSCPMYFEEKTYNQYLSEINSSIEKISQDKKVTCENQFSGEQATTEKIYQLCLTSNQSKTTSAIVSGRSRYAPSTVTLVDCEKEKMIVILIVKLSMNLV